MPWRYLRLFRRDILSALPERLYAAKMAEFRTPFFRSFLVNEPELIDLVLRTRPRDFPKSSRVARGLSPLLGRSVFLTNGETWARQRRIIDPAFEGGRLRVSLPAMQAAAGAAVERLPEGEVEIESAASHAAADVIFRTLFSIPIETEIAQTVYRAFRAHQQSQPLLNPGAFLPWPSWLPGAHRRAVRTTAAELRAVILGMTRRRLWEIETGLAPDDLATKIMTTPDPQTGRTFDAGEMADQVAIFFLAGHETSAAALGWALWLAASCPDAQEQASAEARALPTDFGVEDLARLSFTRDLFREALRLYPPVPMMVREAAGEETFRKRRVPKGAQVVISPWHLHRCPRHWPDPDAFLPERWNDPSSRSAARTAYLPFSAGPRICPGAGFAMAEGITLLAAFLRDFRFRTVPGRTPVPVAHLTVRSRDGIRLMAERRVT